MEQRLSLLTQQDLEELIRETVRVTVHALARDRTPPIMTKAQVAAYLGKTPAVINRYMRDGMPFRKDGTGYPEFYKSEIDRWVDRRGSIQKVSGKKDRPERQELV